MYRLFVGCAVLSILAGCASSGTAPPRQARSDTAVQAAESASGVAGAPALPAGAPVKVVDIKDFDYRTVCKDVAKPGSRIVVGQHCYSVSENDARRVRDGRVEAALREQEEVTLDARERDLEHQLPVMMIRR